MQIKMDLAQHVPTQSLWNHYSWLVARIIRSVLKLLWNN